MHGCDFTFIVWSSSFEINKSPLYCSIQGGLAATFDLAAFRKDMIAPVKKSVNHSKTVTSMREMRRIQCHFVRGDSTVSLRTQTYFRLSRFSPSDSAERISTAGNTSAFAGYSTVENVVVFSYCLFTVSMFFFCGSTKFEHYD